MTIEEARKLMKEYCKGIGPMYEAKWLKLIQLAYQKGRESK